ncbi:MAG: helix-turn-helix domain-containing protein [Pirellulaceae bacterium]
MPSSPQSDSPVLIPLSRQSSNAKGQGKRAPFQPLLPNFVAGYENRLVGFVCGQDVSIVQRGNPLLIVGASGVGKSAIARTLFDLEISLSPREERIGLFEPAIDFARRFTEAIDAGTVDSFRQTFCNARVVVIEDLHLMKGKNAAQIELCSRLTERIDNDLPTILTCRRLPTEVDGLLPSLASCVLPGLTIPLQLPGPTARLHIIRSYAQLREISITEDQMVQLERELPRDATASALCSAVQQLALVSLDADRDVVTDKDIQSVTASFSAHPELPIGKIARAVARRFKLKTADLKSSSRRQQVVRARSMAMFLGRQLTQQSLQAIGQFFGGRDHSTVIHAIRSTEQLIGSDPSIARVADDVLEQLTAG